MFGTFSLSDLATNLSQDDRIEAYRIWTVSPPLWSHAASGQNPAALEQWLGGLRPDDWHEIVLRFNWDGGDLAPIAFIAARPDADRATILSILLEQDVRFFDGAHRRHQDADPVQRSPDGAVLLEIIARGFAAGHYTQARFRPSHAAAALPRTHDYLANLGDAAWPLPDRAWAPCDGTAHRPDFVWDHAADCQRLPFEHWLRHHLMPH